MHGKTSSPQAPTRPFHIHREVTDGRLAVLLFKPQGIRRNSPPGHGVPAHRLWACDQPRTQKAQKWVQGAEPGVQKGRHHSLVHNRLA